MTAIDTRDPTNAGGSDRAVPHDLDPGNSSPEPIALEPTKPASSPTGIPRDTGGPAAARVMPAPFTTRGAARNATGGFDQKPGAFGPPSYH
jgi:hypothetical protein